MLVMENKCNKTPNNNIKYLDHVYCHTSENKNYIRANNVSGAGAGGTASAGTDLLTLLKENKQLKAMLLLHLDLIQEQSEQLIAKEKKISTLTSELEIARAKSTQLETQTDDLQKQLQRQLKRIAVGEISSLPPPPLAKIQCQKGTSPTTNIIGECNGKLISKIILHRVSPTGSDGTHSPHSMLASDSVSDIEDNLSKSLIEEEEHLEEEAEEEIEEELEEEDEEEEEETLHTSDDSNDDSSLHSKPKHCKTIVLQNSTHDAKPRHNASIAPTSSEVPEEDNERSQTPSRGKQMPLMLWHTPDAHSDDSISCDSIADVDQRSGSINSPTNEKIPCEKIEKTESDVLPPPSSSTGRRKPRRYPYLSTTELYSTRDWEDEEFSCDYEFIKEEIEALQSDAPMLEIPKWTEHELTPLYSIEGTEDLCDDTFNKRHVKLEVDEKRRKKWDVQQIREQRRIEKLKRRHCKEELQMSSDQQMRSSFYPPADGVQFICFVNDLPVQAFGEMVPKLSIPSAEYSLPWLDDASTITSVTTSTTATTTTTTSTATRTTPSLVATMATSNSSASTSQAQQQQLLNSSFVFLKKRRRHQSQTPGAQGTRQRNAATVKVASNQSVASATTSSSASSTTQSGDTTK